MKLNQKTGFTIITQNSYTIQMYYINVETLITRWSKRLHRIVENVIQQFAKHNR